MFFFFFFLQNEKTKLIQKVEYLTCSAPTYDVCVLVCHSVITELQIPQTEQAGLMIHNEGGVENTRQVQKQSIEKQIQSQSPSHIQKPGTTKTKPEYVPSLAKGRFDPSQRF